MSALRTLLVAAATALAATPALAGPPAPVEITYDQFTLPNGLRVLVHTDRKAPIVAVNIWYHVGSKEEPRGRSGFAHLFEHLMFQASENHPGEYFDPFELVGATDQNGTTNTDRTNYFENVPTTALDTALWMESDRMGHLIGAIDQAALDEQRGVVQNEKRQGENQPYGQVWELLYAALYPEGHPYHHTTIGSMNDLNAATLDDVKNWFRSWYGPNNAVLVLAGDIDVATAKAKVTKYFGDIAPTAKVPKLKPQIAARTTSTRATSVDAVPQVRIMRAWNVPGFGTADADRLDLLAQVLGGARSSRLDQRLVFKDKLVDSVTAWNDSSELGGLFFIQADVKAGVDPAAVEKAIDEEVASLRKSGPTADELARARTVMEARFLRGIERIGGFGGKADVLAMCTVYTGKPDCYRTSLKNLAAARPAQLAATAKKWLAKGDYTMVITPGARTPLAEAPAVTGLAPTKVAPPAKGLKAVPSDVDRSAGPPMPTTFPPLTFPAIERATLSNGAKVVLAHRPGLPLLQVSLQVADAGFASDPAARQGTASFAMGMLDEGAGGMGALALGDKVESLGAILSTGASFDGATVYLSALTRNLEPSLALFADVVLRPTFDATELERVRAQWLAGMKQEKARPGSIARRVLYPALYGAGHPYATSPSGTGTEATIAALTSADLKQWAADHLRPDKATLLVVGDVTLAELTPKLEAALAGWKAPAGAAPTVALPAVKAPTKPRVLLVDQPAAPQAVILIGQLMPPSTDPGATDLEIANAVLGGTFGSRLNMNLREAKHWSYGSYAFITDALGPRVWMASAPVQTDRAADAAKELEREIREYATGARPALPAELTKIQSTEVRTLPGSYETAGAVLGTLTEIVNYRRPDDWAAKRAAAVSAMTPATVQKAAGAIKPAAMTWVIVGDLAKIEPAIRALKLGDVKVVDADGKVVR